MLFLRLLLSLLLIMQLTLSATTIDFNQIAKETKESKKSVMVFFHTEDCPYCKKMIAEEFENRIVRDRIDKEFYFVDINLDSKTKIIYKDFKGSVVEFGKFFHIQFYPTILFMDKNIVVSSIKGYRNPSKFDIIMKYIATKSYESMDLETFANELEMMD